MNVEAFLKDRGVPFDTLPHRTEYTASRTAQALHVPGRNFAKTVVVQADNHPVLAVVQATRWLNLGRLQQVLGCQRITLSPEAEFAALFPDCEPGAVPPFGSQYQIETVVDDGLAEDEYIVFDGNTHDRAVSMRFADYASVEHPRVAHITS
jgi:Ala-tRNA(Pro) deacylase